MNITTRIDFLEYLSDSAKLFLKELVPVNEAFVEEVVTLAEAYNGMVDDAAGESI